MEISEKKKSNKLLVFGLVLLVVLVFGAIGYSTGKKEVKDEETNAPKEVKEVIEKKSTYDEINAFFSGAPDKDLKYLTLEQAREAVPRYDSTTGGDCDITNVYTKYDKYYVFYRTNACNNSYEISIYEGKDMVLNIKDIYPKITFKDNKKSVFAKPIIKNGKVFYIADRHKESGAMTFAYVDLKDKIEEVEVNDLEVTH